MSDTTVPPELLDLDLASIDTSFSVLRGGMYDLVIKESSIEATKDGTGFMWVVKLNPITDSTGVKGESIKAGSATLFHRMGLTPTDRYPLDAVAKNVARFIQACRPVILGVKGSDLANNAEGLKTKAKLFEGRQIQAKVEAMPEGLDKKTSRHLPPRNEISQFVKAT